MLHKLKMSVTGSVCILQTFGNTRNKPELSFVGVRNRKYYFCLFWLYSSLRISSHSPRTPFVNSIKRCRKTVQIVTIICLSQTIIESNKLVRVFRNAEPKVLPLICFLVSFKASPSTIYWIKTVTTTSKTSNVAMTPS